MERDRDGRNSVNGRDSGDVIHTTADLRGPYKGWRGDLVATDPAKADPNHFSGGLERYSPQPEKTRDKKTRSRSAMERKLQKEAKVAREALRDKDIPRMFKDSSDDEKYAKDDEDEEVKPSKDRRNYSSRPKPAKPPTSRPEEDNFPRYKHGIGNSCGTPGCELCRLAGEMPGKSDPYNQRGPYGQSDGPYSQSRPRGTYYVPVSDSEDERTYAPKSKYSSKYL